jgi:hypothetical protein
MKGISALPAIITGTLETCKSKSDMKEKVKLPLDLTGVTVAEFTSKVQKALEGNLATWYKVCPDCVAIVGVMETKRRRLAGGISLDVEIYAEDSTAAQAVAAQSKTVNSAMVKDIVTESFVEAGAVAPETLGADVPAAGLVVTTGKYSAPKAKPNPDEHAGHDHTSSGQPTPSPSSDHDDTTEKGKKDDNKAVIGGAVGGVIGGLIALVLAYFFCFKKSPSPSSDPVPAGKVEEQLTTR